MSIFRPTTGSVWRLRLISLAVLFVILASLFGRTLSVALAARRSYAVSAPRVIPGTDVNPYGTNVFLTREVEDWKRDKTLRMISEAGIGWVHQQFPWEEVEPVRKGEYVDPATGTNSWAKFDEIVAACEAYGLQIVARLDRPPDWTRQDNTYQEAPPDNYEDYGDYVYEFVKRYKGRVNYIQIWNEPNIFPEWGNSAVDPAAYVELLKVAYRRAKEANPNVYVLCAPLAITLGQAHPEPGKWIAMSDLQFLEEMYKAGARDYFDIYLANAFGMDQPPEAEPDPEVLNFQRVVLHRQIMERYGDENKAVWFSEFGWNAAPESFSAEKLVWRRVSEQQQAEYTVRAIQLARDEWPWAGVFMIWYFRQVGNISPDRADYYFRMVDADFTPRPLYLAVQNVAGVATVARPGLWQESNPAVSHTEGWRTVIDTAASAGAYLACDTAGESVTLTFEGTGVDLWVRQSSAGRLLVTLDGRPAPGITPAADGTSYVDLPAVGSSAYGSISLVRGALPGQHTLRLTMVANQAAEADVQECTVDAFEVLANDGTPFPYLSLGGLLAGMLVDGWLLWRVWRRARWVLRAP